jgi:hypothetical protein
MNADILKEEFQSFISELEKFAERFESNKNVSIKGLFDEPKILSVENNLRGMNVKYDGGDNIAYKNESKITITDREGNSNGHKRKDLRRNTILDFIKGHNGSSIKDIVPNVTGCSEKTVQRELILLIDEKKIKKTGERRWSRYFIT